jgi:hypothetical protein
VKVKPMEFRFNADEWTRLSTTERVRRCGLWEEEARRLAEGAPPKMAASYLSMAREWRKLADEIEGADQKK